VLSTSGARGSSVAIERLRFNAALRPVNLVGVNRTTTSDLPRQHWSSFDV
jgi:hypothetical protein